jgi:ubiquinone/menaquinone biosynthesis C-methylase UbiE
MYSLSGDKQIEKERYEKRAKIKSDKVVERNVGIDSVPLVLRAPYLCYISHLKSNITARDKVLEIGAGTGEFSTTLITLASDGAVTATDISEASLQLLHQRYSNVANLETKVADMEALPFEDESFDVVCSAGSLSYGDNLVVMNEIFRVLRGGGRFICVDSLNHNPIYKVNRWIHYKRGNRTLSTLKSMPTRILIKEYSSKFGGVSVSYFGSISWATQILSKFLSDDVVAKISDRFDLLIRVKRSAFKFVMVVTKY